MLYTNTILDTLFQRANDPDYADKIAVEQVGGRKLTYRDLMTSVDAIASNLVASGFQHGDRALLLVRPSVYTMQIVLGVIRAGGAVIVGDPAMGKAVFESRMRFAQPTWVFAESIILLLQKWDWLRRIARSRGLDLPEISEMDIQNIVNVGKIPFLAPMTFDNLSQHEHKNIETHHASPDDDMMIVFTSGTTGNPKGVVHTLKSVGTVIQTIHNHLQLADQDVLYSYALHLSIPVLMSGGKAILPPRKITPEKTLAAYNQYGITRTFEVPAHMNALADYLLETGQKLPAKLQDILLGAAPVFPDFLHKLQSVLATNTQVWSIYGMTEILPACLVNMEEKLKFDLTQGDLAGKPVPGVIARIAEDGELILSGDALFNRYLGHEFVSEHPTGDIATIDKQGRIILLGRKKDMIIRGNYNVYPALFEPTIRQIEGINDCAMVGIYNPQPADEEIVLFIEGNILESTLRKNLLSGEYSIDTYAQPDHIFFCEIPKNGRSLKVDKVALRADARQRLGLSQTKATQVLEPKVKPS